MPITVYINMCELGTLGEATKSRIAEPNSDHGKSVKATINSLIYRRGRGSQSTVHFGDEVEQFRISIINTLSVQVHPHSAIQMPEKNHICL
jgi:hypothetical protein